MIRKKKAWIGPKIHDFGESIPDASNDGVGRVKVTRLLRSRMALPSRDDF